MPLRCLAPFRDTRQLPVRVRITLIATLIGDSFGSPWEGRTRTGTRIGSFTDDTEQAVGVALWLSGRTRTAASLKQALISVYSGADRGYGQGQSDFLEGRPTRTDSFGNGAAMRAAPIGAYSKSAEQVVDLVRTQCSLTHQHPDAIAGALTVALGVYLGFRGQLGELLNRSERLLLPEPGREYVCSLEAAESVPPAVRAATSTNSFGMALKTALSYGGDTDTIAAMACAMSAAQHGVGRNLLRRCAEAHTDNMAIVRAFADPDWL